MRALLFIVIAFLPTPLFAQNQTLVFQWKKGDVFSYAVKQTTTIDEILQNDVTKKLQPGRTETEMNLTYTWTVMDVSETGVATIEKKVLAFKSTSKRTAPGKDNQPETTMDTLDSSVDADREKMPFLGKVAVVAKVDPRGNVVEAKSDFGEAAVNQFKTELPFRLALSDKPLAAGLNWERSFSITLDPKYGGTGEQYPTVQKCNFKGMSGAYAVIGCTTALKDPPKSASDLRPLVPLLWEGDVFFDVAKGRYHACKLVAAKELKNHEGDGTKFDYKSEYVESFQEKK